jgi:hypothetical protein
MKKLAVTSGVTFCTVGAGVAVASVDSALSSAKIPRVVTQQVAVGPQSSGASAGDARAATSPTGSTSTSAGQLVSGVVQSTNMVTVSPGGAVQYSGTELAYMSTARQGNTIIVTVTPS